MTRIALLAFTMVVAVAGLSGCRGLSCEKLINEGIGDFQVGKLDDAEAKLARGLAGKPAHAAGLFYMGRLHHTRGGIARAIYYYQCCLDVAPGYPGARKHFAQARKQAGRMGETLRFLPDPVSR